jgi:epsilon-lactone hydrolase
MTTNIAQLVLRIPARDIPIPTSVSNEAGAALSRGGQPFPDFPPLNDLAAWRRRAAASDEAVLPMIQAAMSHIQADVTETLVETVRVFVITPIDASPSSRRVYLDIHGGALYMGSGAFCRAMGLVTAVNVGARVWAVDYRMPPDNPYPAPLDDCLAVYRRLLKEYRPEEIIVGGVSAGGNLAAAVILRARAEGLPMPAAAVLLSPEVDLTESGDSFRTNQGLDTVLTASLMPVNLLYAAGRDLTDPYVSPLFGDFSKGFPPTLLASGTRDLFLSNTVRMHRNLRAAGVAAELHVFEAMPHGGFGGAPEDRELAREVRRFVDAKRP